MNKWEELDKKYIWHPFTQMKGWIENPQLVIERGDGVKLYDTEGRGYYDGISSLWVNIHGHRRREIDDAIKAQIDKISHSTLLGLINQPSAEFAEKLVKITPEGLNKDFFIRMTVLPRLKLPLKLLFSTGSLKAGPKNSSLSISAILTTAIR